LSCVPIGEFVSVSTSNRLRGSVKRVKIPVSAKYGRNPANENEDLGDKQKNSH
jgi:hypothetical protein